MSTRTRWRWSSSATRPVFFLSIVTSSPIATPLYERRKSFLTSVGRTTGPGDAPKESFMFARFSVIGSVRTMFSGISTVFCALRGRMKLSRAKASLFIHELSRARVGHKIFGRSLWTRPRNCPRARR